jgi:hypothetical protein
MEKRLDFNRPAFKGIDVTIYKRVELAFNILPLNQEADL